MAELKSTLVSGSLAAKKIYQNGTPLDEKFATTIALSGSTLQLKNAGGVVISSATIPAAAFNVSGNKVYCATAGYSPAGSATSPVATIATATPAFDGGTPSIQTSSTTASASGLTITDTDTDPGSGIYITTAGTATARRSAVLYNGAVAGYVSVADNASASAEASGSSENLNSNKYYVTAVTVPASKTLSSVTLAQGTTSANTTLSTITANTYSKIALITLSGANIDKITVTGPNASYGKISEIALTSPGKIENVYGTGQVTIGSGKTLAKLNVTGTLTNLGSSGTITSLTGSVKVGTYTSSGTITTMSGTRTITTHSGTTTVSSNTGTLNISANTDTLNISANTGTVKYIDWSIAEDSSGNLTFTYTG